MMATSTNETEKIKMKMNIFKITVTANNYVTKYGFVDQSEMLKCLAEITNNKDGYSNKTITIESDTVKVSANRN